MTVIDYLREDGSGPYSEWRVSDRVPSSGSELELVFIFESPHVEELAKRVPVVGGSGRSALKFLAPDEAEGSLGGFVTKRANDNDGRIAILNVCNVPMQAAAFGDGGGPDLNAGDWAQIKGVRTSRAKSIGSIPDPQRRAAAEALVERLSSRIQALAAPSSCRFVAAGVFAQRMVRALPEGLATSPLRVPHPSFNQWSRPKNQELPDMKTLRDCFAKASS